MGISVNCARFLLAARERGVEFGSTLTIGRQDLNIDDYEFARLFRDFRSMRFDADARGRWVDPLLRLLGAREVATLDYSAYEGATLIHDLNQPVPDAWMNRYDVVLEAGSLEHVFNFPVSMASCMRLVKTGGHLIMHTPANNWCGHGLYQFSPELFYRVLSPENGFTIERLIIHEEFLDSQWYEVPDPAVIGKRTELINNLPTMILILARKTAHLDRPFASPPLQSDYTVLWKKNKAPAPLAVSGPRRDRISPAIKNAVKKLLGPYKSYLYQRRLHREQSFNRPQFYKPVRK
jgi:hypothetical protein